MSPKRKRKWLKRILGLLFVLLAMLLLAYAAVHTPWGRTRLAKKLSVALSDKLNAEVEIQDLAGWLPFRLYADSIRIAHEGEPCVTLRQCHIQLDVNTLLNNVKNIQRLDLEEVVYHRWLPPAAPGTPATPLPRLHIEALNIKTLRLHTLKIEEQDLTFAGTFSSQDGIALQGQIIDSNMRMDFAVKTKPHPKWDITIHAKPQSFLQPLLRIPPQKSFHLTASNQRETAWLPVEIDVQVPGWAGIIARIERASSDAKESFNIQSSLSLDESLIPPKIRALAGAEFAAEGLVHLDGRVENLHVHNERADLRGQLSFIRATGALQADYALDLKKPAWPMGSNEVAAVQCVATGQVIRVNTESPIRLRLNARPLGLRGLPADALSLLGESPEIELDTTLTSPLRIESFRVSGTHVTASASGTIHRTNRTVNLDWTLDIPRVHHLPALADQPIRTSIQGTGRITHSLDQPQIQAQIQLPGAQYKDHSFTQATLGVQASRTVTGWQGEFDTDFTYREMPFVAVGHLHANTNQIALTQLVIENAQHSELNGALTFTPRTRQVSGNVQLGSTDLAPWGSVFDFPLTGRATASLQFLPRDHGFGLDATVHAEGLLAKKIAVSDTHWQLTRVNLLDAARPWIATGRVERAQMNAIRLPQTALSFRVTTNGIDGTFSSQVQAPNLNLQVHGDLSHTPEQDTIQLRTADGEVAGKKLHLPSPLTLQRDAAEWSIAPSEIHWGNIRARAHGASRGGRISAQVTVPELAISELLPATLSDLTGQLNATLDLGGSHSNLTARLKGGITQLGVADPEFEDLPPFALRFAAGLSNGVLRADAQLANESSSQLKASLSVPASASMTPAKLQIERTRELSAQLAGHLDLELINALPVAIDQRLQGLLAVDLRAAGSLEAPTLSGTSSLRKGHYEHATLGTQITDLQFNLVASEQKLTLDALQGVGPAKGLLSGHGHIDLDAKKGFPGAFHLKLNQLRLVQNDLLRAFAQGTLILEGSTQAATLSGNLSITPMDLHIPRYLPPASSQFVIIDPERTPAKQALPRLPARKNENPLQLDVQITAPGKLTVDGRGLRSDWSGQLQVSGKSTRPQITGTLAPDRGTFDFFGQQFRLTESNIRFTGSVPPNPLFDVVFERKKTDFIVYLRVSGTAKAPNIRLESEPPLPEEELLPQLLFGKDASELSPLQALKMVRAANALKGGGSTLDLMGRARKWLSVDELEIEQADDENAVAKARVGKALSDRVYIEGESELGGDANALRLEVELTPRLSLESDIQSEMKRGIGLKWKRRF